jgi:hypothetical protein
MNMRFLYSMVWAKAKSRPAFFRVPIHGKPIAPCGKVN